VDDEVAFLLTLAATPDDYTAHLVYADWLQEQHDPGSECLRAWVELVQHPYSDATWRELSSLFDRFRFTLQAAEPEWVTLVGEARLWVPQKLAETAVRLYLRVRDGRKLERQWIASPRLPLHDPTAGWRVEYWPNQPSGWNRWKEQRCLQVDPVTAQVEAIRSWCVGRPPEAAT
jgi:uncharacterized protein (TIGR02996 family)